MFKRDIASFFLFCILTVALFGFLLLTVVHYVFSLPSTIKKHRNLLSGENCRTHALTWLLQQAHANQNHSRACFMSLKELVLPGAEVPYLLGNYRFLVWSLLSFRIKLPFFPLIFLVVHVYWHVVFFFKIMKIINFYIYGNRM